MHGKVINLCSPQPSWQGSRQVGLLLLLLFPDFLCHSEEEQQPLVPPLELEVWADPSHFSPLSPASVEGQVPCYAAPDGPAHTGSCQQRIVISEVSKNNGGICSLSVT